MAAGKPSSRGAGWGIVGATLVVGSGFIAAAATADADGPPSVFRKPARAITMVEDGFLWIDAEDFADYGGWLLDTQFVHLVGSAYLIAAGVGEPVEDAGVAVLVPRPGRYRLWVRARNWLKDHAPGRFEVAVDGTPSARVFGGASTEEWIWESGGAFELPAGITRVALHDLTGYYGRCDALILTTEAGYIPPSSLEAIRQERSRLTGLSLEARFAGKFDVIVVGAGAAGSTAALAAARIGATTALIQNRPVLGGNASVELGVPINGAASAHRNARESGIIEELGRIKARYNHPKMSQAFRMAAEAEPNLSVFLNNHVFGVEMARANRIASVKAVDTLTGTVSTYQAKVFIDGTGDGWVGYFAGAEYRLGREARDEFDEDLAPEKADKITMSGCLMGERALSYRAVDTGKPAPYTPPAWAAQLPPAAEFGRKPRNMTTGEWWLEHPGDIDDLWDAERARDELIRITFGYWDFIKNAWEERARARDYRLAYVPIVEAKRESRRLMGDYVLTQNDVLSGVVFPDRISYGGWPLDVHHPKGIFSGKDGPFHSNARVPIYTIPFRCLYSVNIDNLLFAGRDMSVTHLALGSVRVQGTLAALGQAAGTAAALCVRDALTPRELARDHIGRLQQILVKHDQYIPGIINEDPLDLARKATPAASSTARYAHFNKAEVRKGDLHPLNMPRAVMFPLGAERALGSVYVSLSSSLDKAVEVALHLRSAKDSGDYSAREDVAVATAMVPPGVEAWVEFQFDRAVDAPYAWVWLPKRDGVSWRLMQCAPFGACRAYGGDKAPWTTVMNQYYAFYTEPALAIETGYDVGNITNGITRVVETDPNIWASDPAQPLPQWIELAFDTPERINTVYLTFDTDMNAAYHTVPLVPECVRDYELSWHDGETWRSIVREEGNFQRRRIHRFDPVTATRLRLTVHATHGAPSARVFEIRAYDENY